MEKKNCISALIAEKTIEALYGKVLDSYCLCITDWDYEGLSDDEKDEWEGELDYYDDGKLMTYDNGDPIFTSYSRHIDREIWFGDICENYGNIAEREEILKSLDVETVKHELQMRYNALQELENYNQLAGESYTLDVHFETIKEIVMWTRNGFIS